MDNSVSLPTLCACKIKSAAPVCWSLRAIKAAGKTLRSAALGSSAGMSPTSLTMTRPLKRNSVLKTFRQSSTPASSRVVAFLGGAIQVNRSVHLPAAVRDNSPSMLPLSRKLSKLGLAACRRRSIMAAIMPMG
jgi:hypothetical protein